MKQQIIQAALKLFSEKGYHSTNVQEIANCAGIARGTLYNYFSSKKNILIAIYEHYLDCLYKSLEKEPPYVRGTFDQRIDYLHSVLTSYLSVAFEHEDFLIMQMKEQNINDELVIEMIQEKRNKIYHRFQELMEHVGGKELNHCTLDMAIILNSLIEEYSAVVILDGASIAIDDLVEFITKTIVCLFNGFRKKDIEPIISENYLERKEVMHKNIYMSEINEKLNSIQKIIQNVYLPSESKREVDSSLFLINSEMKKKKPDIVIVKGMLRNIAQVDEVKFIAENLLEMIEKFEMTTR